MTAPTLREHRVTAFIDTSAMMAFAEGARDAVELFSASVLNRAQYLINPVVVQELMLADTFGRYPKLVPKVLELKMIPLETIDSRQLLADVRHLRNRAVHVNEFLIFASAQDCDFLITYDDKFKILRQGRGPAIVTPQEFLETIRH